MKQFKVALVHDYLREYGGAERVLETLHELFPEAPIYTAYLNLPGLGPHAQRIKRWNIKTSWIQKFPAANTLLSPFRIFAPMVFEGFDLKEYDVIISSSSIYFAKAVVTPPETLHLAYIHTPPRYLYGYTTSYNYKKHWWTRIGGEVINHFLRLWDFEVSQRPDILIANSQNVASRINKFYRREAVVIYPPVDIDQFKGVKKDGGEYFLSLGRLVRGKGTESIVEACSKLNLPLKVAGTGSELARLKLMSGQSVEFVGNVNDEERIKTLAGAKATIVASQDEDFGIVPVESMAAGTPVIAYKSGGFLETVIEGKTGEFFEGEGLVDVLKSFDPQKYRPEDCRKQAEKFSQDRFKQKILDLIKLNVKN